MPTRDPQLLGGIEASPGTRNVASPVSQDRLWPGPAQGPRTAGWGVGMVSPSFQGDLTRQGQPPGRGGLQIPSAPGTDATWELWIQGDPGARWSAEPAPHLPCFLIVAEWAAAPVNPLARGHRWGGHPCPGLVGGQVRWSRGPPHRLSEPHSLSLSQSLRSKGERAAAAERRL